MKTRNSNNRLLVAMVIIACCCQQITTGSVTKQTGKTKNSTISSKEITATTKHPKVMHQVKTITTTTTTTTSEKPEMEMTTLPNIDMDLDGRSAFINNQYVSDAELTVQDSSSPLYNLLQKQMETMLGNKADKLEIYDSNSPQMKESTDGLINEKLKLEQKPLFAYDMTQFDDYDEEDETSEEANASDYVLPDNCEDTEESLKDSDSSDPIINGNQQNLLNNYGQSIGSQTQSNKPYDSSNYGPQTAQVTSSTYISEQNQNTYVHKKPNKAIQKHQSTKSKPSSYQQISNQNLYGQTKPSEQYTQKDQKTSEQNSNKQHQSTNQKPQYSFANQQHISYDSPKPSSTKPLNHHGKPKPIYTTLNQKLQPSTSFQNSNFSSLLPSNSYVSRLPALITFSPLNPALASNFLYGDTPTPSLSPFSSTSTLSSSSSPSSSQQKRHLTFRTVASSTQYVSSPLADLMFKFSIGMAKPANSNSVTNFRDNPAQVYNLINDQ